MPACRSVRCASAAGSPTANSLRYLATIRPPRRSSRSRSATSTRPLRRCRRGGKRVPVEGHADGIKPPIWRRLLVDGASTLDHVHAVIQAAFGWWNYHLHEFEVDGRRYGVPIPTMTGETHRSTSAEPDSIVLQQLARRSNTHTTSATTGVTGRGRGGRAQVRGR